MLLTNKIYEGNLFMRYSKHLTYAERMFLRARLNRVRHITLDPDGPGVVRIHLVPCHKPDRETPFTAILNGQDILPLNVSWAILLTNFIEALKPYTGKEIRPEEWSAINAQAVVTFVLLHLDFSFQMVYVHLINFLCFHYNLFHYIHKSFLHLVNLEVLHHDLHKQLKYYFLVIQNFLIFP